MLEHLQLHLYYQLTYSHSDIVAITHSTNYINHLLRHRIPLDYRKLRPSSATPVFSNPSHSLTTLRNRLLINNPPEIRIIVVETSRVFETGMLRKLDSRIIWIGFVVLLETLVLGIVDHFENAHDL